MTINGTDLDRLYELYGFKKRKSVDASVRVYTYRAGYFNNADIVPLNEQATTDSDLEQYQRSGFACSVRSYHSLDDAERQLFDGFFAIKVTREKFELDDERFRKRQNDLLGVTYRYIPPPFFDVYRESKSQDTTTLIERVMGDLSSLGPKLVIIEAAAGFGKTCTSYEILKNALGRFSTKIPMLFELSRNRQAKIFRYVLLDEIDRLFPSLGADLVQAQVAKGNLFLIIDGFDELLHRAESLSTDFDEVAPMLETISDLLRDNAKIVLTTRRTAIFAGDNFHQWIEGHGDVFSVSRYSLEQPNLEDWLSYERRTLLADKQFPIQHLSNPVLLAFLAGQNDNEFSEIASNSDALVDQYFRRLLDRETERQELRMEPDEQYEVFINLATRMVDEDFNAEDHEYLQLQIAEQNGKLLAHVRSRYPSESRPTIDELAIKLVSHALMDRKSDEGDRVGFVNDFVLGTFVGESALNSNSDEWIGAEGFVEQAIAAFAPRSDEKKSLLHDKLSFALEFLTPERRINADVLLRGEIQKPVVGETISGIGIEYTSLGVPYPVEDTVFFNCSFAQVSFALNGLKNVTFVGCRFYSCKYDGAADKARGVYVTGCSGDISELEKMLNAGVENSAANEKDELDTCVKSVLEQFWPVGRPHLWPKKQIQTLYRGHSNEQRNLVTNAIHSLQQKGLISIRGDMAEIDTSKIGVIYEILGREEL